MIHHSLMYKLVQCLWLIEACISSSGTDTFAEGDTVEPTSFMASEISKSVRFPVMKGDKFTVLKDGEYWVEVERESGKTTVQIPRSQIQLSQSTTKVTEWAQERQQQMKEMLTKAKFYYGTESEESLPADYYRPELLLTDKRYGIDVPQLHKDMQHDQTYMILHRDTVENMKTFLKRKEDVPLYKDMDVLQFVNDRLLHKRSIVFIQPTDNYVLQDGTASLELYNPTDSDYTSHPDKALTYEEMPFNAVSGMSSPTQFINDGGRGNQGVPDVNPDSFIKRGIYVGLVGARLEKPGVMEYKDMVEETEPKDADDTTKWYHARDDRSYEIPKPFADKWLNLEKLQARLRTTLEIYLFDANQRGEQANKQVYASVVGLGAGIWALDKDSVAVIWDKIVDATKAILQDVNLPNVAVVEFQKYGSSDGDKTKYGDGLKVQNTMIKVNFRNPAAKLPDGFQEKDYLMMAMYPWDSNAQPGNEYYLNHLATSGDPAAAASSTIAYAQNSFINQEIKAEHAVVYWAEGSQIHHQRLEDYLKPVPGKRNGNRRLMRQLME